MNKLHPIPNINIQRLMSVFEQSGVRQIDIAEALGVEPSAVSRMKFRPQTERTTALWTRRLFNLALEHEDVREENIYKAIEEEQ